MYHNGTVLDALETGQPGIMYTTLQTKTLDIADDTADTALVSIQPQMLHEAVVAQLSRMIIEGALAPGTRLNERMLCDKLGVSRTPLREAFRVLAAQGLVALLPNRGAVVPELDEADIAETFEVIAGLEAMSGELACARVTDEEVDEIRALHYRNAGVSRRPRSAGLLSPQPPDSRRHQPRGAQRRPAPDVHEHQQPPAGAAIPLEFRPRQVGRGRARALGHDRGARCPRRRPPRRSLAGARAQQVRVCAGGKSARQPRLAASTSLRPTM